MVDGSNSVEQPGELGYPPAEQFRPLPVVDRAAEILAFGSRHGQAYLASLRTMIVFEFCDRGGINRPGRRSG